MYIELEPVAEASTPMVGVTTTSLFAGLLMVTVACPNAVAANTSDKERTPASFPPCNIITTPLFSTAEGAQRNLWWARTAEIVAELLDFLSGNQRKNCARRGESGK
jgi:hypothetical protein